MPEENLGRRLRIAYLTINDPTDRRSWSGTDYCMARALEKHCGELFLMGPLQPLSQMAGKSIRRVFNLLGRTYLPAHTMSASKILGRMADRKLSETSCDVVFAPAGSSVLAHLQTKLPIVYLSDVTFRLIAGYYPEFSRLLASQGRMADQIEQLAIQKAAQLIYPSSWAARSAIEDYGADPRKVHVVPFGANLEHPPSREQAVRVPPSDRCRLLFVGVNWERKRGDIALETLLELERLGVPAELTIVGCRPPDRVRHPNLRVMPFLNKNDVREREHLYNLYFESHFFLLPTRAECFSIALCEANAFGLPNIATRTGGLSELVVEGLNGFLLPLDARGDQYARRIRDIFADKEKYAALRVSSRAEFECRLNWDTWGREAGKILQSAVEPDTDGHPKAEISGRLSTAALPGPSVEG